MIASELANHLWQSTMCLGLAWAMVRVLRRQSAAWRFRVWLAASIKFLVPFSALAAAGGYLAAVVGLGGRVPALAAVAAEVGAPFHVTTSVLVRPAAPMISTVGLVLMSGWAAIAAAIAITRGIRSRRVTHLVRAAQCMNEGREAAALARVRSTIPAGDVVHVRATDECSEPALVGLLRPAILWPRALSPRLADRDIDAVMAHELVHARRRDNLSAAVHSLVETVFWFHPLLPWLRSRLHEERERACDEAVVAAGHAPESYARTILKVCEFCVSSPWQFASGISGGNLTRRVEAIMNARSIRRLDPLRKTMIATVALALLACPLVVGATTIVPAASLDAVTLPDAPQLSLGAATMTIPTAESAAEPPAIAAARLPADQSPAPASDPAVAQQPPNDPAVCGAPDNPNVATCPPAPDAPVRIGGDIKEPKKIFNVSPVYPAEAMAAGVEGIVIIEATIGTDGTVVDAKILRGQPLLNQAALDAVSQWVFVPTTVNGRTFAVLMTVTVNFRLQ